ASGDRGQRGQGWAPGHEPGGGLHGPASPQPIYAQTALASTAGRLREDAARPPGRSAQGPVDRERIFGTPSPGEGPRERDNVAAQLIAPVVVEDDATEGVAPALEVVGVDQMGAGAGRLGDGGGGRGPDGPAATRIPRTARETPTPAPRCTGQAPRPRERNPGAEPPCAARAPGSRPRPPRSATPSRRPAPGGSARAETPAGRCRPATASAHS